MSNVTQTSKSRTWCFTLNNYTDDEYDRVLQVLRDHSRYGIVGKEMGESGTPHLQGYVYFTSKRHFGGVKKLFETDRIHLELARGSGEDNRRYCSKDADFVEFGVLPKQGKRTDLAEIQCALDSGSSTSEVAENYFTQWVVYRRSFEAYSRIRRRKDRTWKSNVVWIYGPTGTGKTYRAIDEGTRLTLEQPWIAFDNSCTWFDGYQQQKVVIFDDFRGECPLAYLLRLLDRYPMVVPVKGDSTNWQPRIIYITSNLPPRECYPTVDIELLRPLYRRIELVEHQHSMGTYTDETNTIRF